MSNSWVNKQKEAKVIIFEAIERGDKIKVENILNEQPTLFDDSLVCCAVKNGHIQICEYLIEKGANINFGFYTPLYIAAQKGYIEMCKLLIEKGANVNKGVALYVAVENCFIEICQLLIEKGADVNEPFPKNILYVE
eukprot:TRINITY_DN2876_c0_g1_i5.p1 TRINITY_DN2876_c0_g1~~TRINITY_DN2876_c0_g1_i5.p1  ORF type:complete len:137 (+),score=52.80 TRINITY_DN2876_c0_g1_i5:59-469(+)